MVYNGVEVKGMTVAALVSGVKVMRNGQVVGKPGTGSFVTPLHDSGANAGEWRS